MLPSKVTVLLDEEQYAIQVEDETGDPAKYGAVALLADDAWRLVCWIEDAEAPDDGFTESAGAQVYAVENGKLVKVPTETEEALIEVEDDDEEEEDEPEAAAGE